MDIKAVPSVDDACPSCGNRSLFFESVRAEKLCSGCGTVTASGLTAQASLGLRGSFTTRYIGSDVQLLAGCYERFKETKRDEISTEIESIAAGLRLPMFVTAYAFSVYAKGVGQGLLKTCPREDIAPAAVYTACRATGVERLLGEVVARSYDCTDERGALRLHKSLSEALCTLRAPPIRLLNDTEIPGFGLESRILAREILDIANARGLLAKMLPNVAVASAMVIAATSTGERRSITHKNIGEKLGVPLRALSASAARMSRRIGGDEIARKRFNIIDFDSIVGKCLDGNRRLADGSRHGLAKRARALILVAGDRSPASIVAYKDLTAETAVYIASLIEGTPNTGAEHGTVLAPLLAAAGAEQLMGAYARLLDLGPEEKANAVWLFGEIKRRKLLEGMDCGARYGLRSATIAATCTLLGMAICGRYSLPEDIDSLAPKHFAEETGACVREVQKHIGIDIYHLGKRSAVMPLRNLQALKALIESRRNSSAAPQ